MAKAIEVVITPSAEINVEIIGSGPKGADGVIPVKGVDYFDGVDGITPIAGVDYYTASDKQELIDELNISGNDAFYTHPQILASKDWDIIHGLNKYPSVTVIDTAGSVMVGEILFIDMNHIHITFSSEFSGNAYLN